MTRLRWHSFIPAPDDIFGFARTGIMFSEDLVGMLNLVLTMQEQEEIISFPSIKLCIRVNKKTETV